MLERSLLLLHIVLFVPITPINTNPLLSPLLSSHFSSFFPLVPRHAAATKYVQDDVAGAKSFLSQVSQTDPETTVAYVRSSITTTQRTVTVGDDNNDESDVSRLVSLSFSASPLHFSSSPLSFSSSPAFLLFFILFFCTCPFSLL